MAPRKLAKPDGVAAKIPKSCREAKEKLAHAGMAVTPQNLKSMLSLKEMNILQATFRQAMSQDSRETYKALSSDDERRSFVAQYVLDPTLAKTNGFNKKFAFGETASESVEGWITKEELSGPKFLNSKAHAEILIENRELPEREHEIPSLARAGVKQYYYSTKATKKTTGERTEAGTTGDIELKAQEYTEVNAHIDSSFSDGSRKRKTTPKPRKTTRRRRSYGRRTLRRSRRAGN